jgi:trichohyalin
MEIQRRKELERQKDIHKQIEIEHQKNIERQREIDRLQEIEIKREAESRIKLDRERELEKQQELDRQRELKRHLEEERLKEIERLKEVERVNKANKQLELERQRELDRIERQKVLERLEHKREIERQMQIEHEEVERQMEMERQVIERQREYEKKKEAERQKEVERIKEVERLKEVERQKEIERQKEVERQCEIERQEKHREFVKQREIQEQKEIEKQKELKRLEIQREIKLARLAKQREHEELQRSLELERHIKIAKQREEEELSRQKRERELHQRQREKERLAQQLEAQILEKIEKQREEERLVKIAKQREEEQLLRNQIEQQKLAKKIEDERLAKIEKQHEEEKLFRKQQEQEMREKQNQKYQDAYMASQNSINTSQLEEQKDIPSSNMMTQRCGGKTKENEPMIPQDVSTPFKGKTKILIYIESVSGVSKSKKSGNSEMNFLDQQSDSNDSIIEDDSFRNLETPLRMVQDQDMDVPDLDDKEVSQVDRLARDDLFGEDFGLESLDSSNKDDAQPSLYDRFMKKEKDKQLGQSNSEEKKQIEQPVSEVVEIYEEKQVDDVGPSGLMKKSIEVDNEDDDQDLFNKDSPDKREIDEDALQNDDKIMYQKFDESKDHDLSSNIINQSNTQNEIPIPDSNELDTPIYQQSHKMVINDPEDNLELKILEDHSDPLFEDSNKESPGKSSNNRSVVDLDKQDSPINESQINDIGKPQ